MNKNFPVSDPICLIIENIIIFIKKILTECYEKAFMKEIFENSFLFN